LDKAVREFGRLVGVRLAARLVGVSERRVVQAIRDGELKATRLGKDYIVRISDLRRYLQRRRPRGRPRRGPGRPRKRAT
jgi:excisionase family DNA binding protein